MQDGTSVILRPPPTDDLTIAYEVFVAETYKSRRSILPDDVRYIVDIGANVGYTIAYWARELGRSNSPARPDRVVGVCLDAYLLITLVAASRFSFLLLDHIFKSARTGKRRVLIFGAGTGGAGLSLLRYIGPPTFTAASRHIFEQYARGSRDNSR